MIALVLVRALALAALFVSRRLVDLPERAFVTYMAERLLAEVAYFGRVARAEACR